MTLNLTLTLTMGLFEGQGHFFKLNTYFRPRIWKEREILQ